MESVPRNAALLRVLAGAGLTSGGLLLAQPRRIAGTLCPEFPADRDWVVRLLGVRLVVQYAVLLAVPVRPVALGASAVDAIHATSMLPWLRHPLYRRAAGISGAAAAASGAAAGALGRD
jgi:hypothetical protein